MKNTSLQRDKFVLNFNKVEDFPIGGLTRPFVNEHGDDTWAWFRKLWTITRTKRGLYKDMAWISGLDCGRGRKEDKGREARGSSAGGSTKQLCHHGFPTQSSSIICWFLWKSWEAPKRWLIHTYMYVCTDACIHACSQPLEISNLSFFCLLIVLLLPLSFALFIVYVISENWDAVLSYKWMDHMVFE